MSRNLILCMCILCSILLVKNSSAADGALELSVTLSGTVLIGGGYRYILDNDTSIRIGAYIGHQFKPLGIYTTLIQNLSKDDKWFPYVGIGGDVMLAKDKERLKKVFFIRAVGGYAYRPNPDIVWSSELWLAFFPKKQRIAPIGISMSLLNRL